MPYRFVYVLIAFLGTVLSLDIVWDIADTLNGLMTIPNLVAVLLLSGVIVADTKKYLQGNHINDVDDTPVPSRHEVEKR
jgi:AGCS family alanine or glycine:cation symporter